MAFKTAEQADYEIKCAKEDDYAWLLDMTEARRILVGAEDLSFDARCHMLVDQGFHCLRAPDVLRRLDREGAMK